MEDILIPLYIASGMIVADIISGILKGINTEHSLKSSIMSVGMGKKLIYWYVIAFALFVNISAQAWDMMPDELGMIYPATCLGVIAFEFNSNMENIVAVWPELIELVPVFKIFDHSEKEA